MLNTEKNRRRGDIPDIRHLAAIELRQAFGAVSQEAVLFAGTLYESEPNGGFSGGSHERSECYAATTTC